MKQTVRFNTFETNSSSTHSMVIIPDEDVKAWENDELYYMENAWSDKSKKLLKANNNNRIFTKEFLKEYGVFDDEEFPKESDTEEGGLYEDYDYESAISEYLRDDLGLVTYSSWGYEDLEEDCNSYTTKSGEVLHIYCRYGFDG